MKDIYTLLNHIEISKDGFEEIKTTKLEKTKVKEKIFEYIKKGKKLNK
ncbi:hypothetical protein ABEO66_21915 [Bacillus pacificus]